MRTIGVIGLGKIGMPIAELLLKSGFNVVGFRRSAMDALQAAGGTPLGSPAEVARQADIILSCLPSEAALDEVVSGPQGLLHGMRAGQICLELGTYPTIVKERQRERLAQIGAIFLDGEISGTPGMVAARKSAVYISGDAEACESARPVIAGFSDACFYFGAFGSSIKVKLIANLLVTLNVTAAGEAMALARETGIDPHAIIQAVTSGAGNSTQFAIRAPWMVDRKFLPAQGSIELVSHYQKAIKDMATDLGVATPMLDKTIELFNKAMADGLGGHDVAAITEVIVGLPPGGTS
ncbi:NAD(P)-dependent oxidoreductase [Roseiarcaceae bacterium H3SJ34-1]|uniref:NAD(P)-dependent oxidoreductase n=1 Tax=Terripilifer ovatus TaxID=3032367 RepID=UPI003AB979E6|nr:NAD(P)-dependent oxidoreductase [Roseiarcaceae bacterium H3SJ34-1]